MNNHWTEAKEKKLLEWQQQSRLHSLGHGRAQEIYSKKNNRMLIPSIVFGAIATLLDGIALVLTDNYVPFVIAALLITAITTILDGIIQVTKPISIASGHEDMAKGYNKIILQIDAMLSKEANERQDGSEFISKIEEELIALKTGGIKIPSDVWKGVRDAFINKELDFQHKSSPCPSIVVHGTDIKSEVSPDTEISGQDVPPVGLEWDHDQLRPPESISGNVDAGTSAGSDSNDSLPTFELRIDNHPKTKIMEKMLYDYEISRF